MSWMDVIKLDQINIAGTGLDTRPLPEDDDDENCCDVVKNLWLKFASNIDDGRIYHPFNYEKKHKEFVDIWLSSNPYECKEFIDILMDIHLGTPYGKAVRKYLHKHDGIRFTPTHIEKIKDVLMAYAECKQKKETENFDWIDWARRL